MIEAQRFNDAASTAYHFVYDIFCDWYVEITKPIFQTGSEDGKSGNPRHHRLGARPDPEAAASLHALHHRRTCGRAPARRRATRLLVLAAWPKPHAIPGAEAATAEMSWVIEMIKGIRSVRSEMNVPAGAKIQMVLTGANDDREGTAGAQPRRDPVPWRG